MMFTSGVSHSTTGTTLRVLGVLSALSFLLLTGPAFAVIAGDVNGSGAVDAVDVQLVINGALGIGSGLDCDINKNGQVNAVDIQLVINAALGIQDTGTQDTGTDETILLPGNVPLEMVWIQAGTFMMGSPDGEQDRATYETPQHQVTLTQGFWMGKYELTKRQWTAVMGTTPWSGQDYVLNDPESPAVYVSLNDAQAFITALNTYTGKTFRLPSEAQWEYACRAGTATRFYWGDDPSYTQIGTYAWYKDNCSSQMYAHVVGLKVPNAFGLYDMIGNVWEWCQDGWHDNYTGAPTDGSAWVSATDGSAWVSARILPRVRRGSDWNIYVNFYRSATRSSIHPDNTDSNIGFRLAR